MNDYLAFIEKRRESSNARLGTFQETLRRHIGTEYDEVIGDHTCIYAVGSGGRGEFSSNSDLDLFLIKEGKPQRVDEVRLQGAIIRAMREEKFGDPSNDASFLKIQEATHLIERIGEPRDDAENTFTMRMLLLLESQPILGSEAYHRLISRSLEAYWKNTDTHSNDYLPIILVNDIIRYWRILLLNYESKTAQKQRELAAKPLHDEDRADRQATLDSDRRLRSHKLRFSRCLMCYASIAYLLAEVKRAGRVDRSCVDAMVKLMPLQRLEKALKIANCPSELNEIGDRLFALYASFLERTDHTKRELLKTFGCDERYPYEKEANQFGETLFTLIRLLGQDNPLYRYVVV